MNWDQLQGKWKQATGKAKEKWGKLTDSDIDIIRGQRDQLVGKIQERYGLLKEAAQQQADEWVAALALTDEPSQEIPREHHEVEKAPAVRKRRSRGAGRS